MTKRHHEVRDPVHVFIHFGLHERAVIDSAPFQRLRHVHQLALSYLVYPGASHKRFEHSLGVMEVAGRIFDVVTRPDKVSDPIRDVIPEYGQSEHQYWRSVLRMAALCHDTGHLPFSHAAEEELLPDGWDHERITREIIHSPEMEAVWANMRPRPDPDDVVKLALGPRKVEKLRLGLSFDAWQAILAEIIVGDVFGADRIDYLLRDSLHTGVAYGRFDHHRLIDTLRIIPGAPEGAQGDGGENGQPDPQLGCERGGLESAEALMLARYFMFAQVYYHPVRLAYNEHLKDFLVQWLPDGRFPTDAEGHLRHTDVEVLAAIGDAAREPRSPGHDPARRIVEREHFRIAYHRRPDDLGDATRALADAAAAKFGAERIRYAASPRRGDPPDFPVYDRDGTSVSSLSLSGVLSKLPAARDEYVLVDPAIRGEVKRWITGHRDEIIERTVAEQAAEEE